MRLSRTYPAFHQSVCLISDLYNSTREEFIGIQFLLREFEFMLFLCICVDELGAVTVIDSSAEQLIASVIINRNSYIFLM